MGSKTPAMPRKRFAHHAAFTQWCYVELLVLRCQIVQAAADASMIPPSRLIPAEKLCASLNQPTTGGPKVWPGRLTVATETQEKKT